MTNLPNDKQHNFISFLRHNKPNPPQAHQDLEQAIMNSLEPQESRKRFNCEELGKNITQAISISNPFKLVATGFLFTSVSFCLKTPQVAIEPKDLENFLVKNWHDTLHKNSYSIVEETEAYLLLPTETESTSSLPVSAQ